MADRGDAAPEPGRKRVTEELIAIIRDAFGQDDLVINRHTTARDVAGWDSFKMVEIILAAEEHYSIELDPRDVDGFRCVGDMVEAIVRRLNG